eukprot:scaffold4855_cov261-Pinguiococcus_pyrenoidosus.AAC.2
MIADVVQSWRREEATVLELRQRRLTVERMTSGEADKTGMALHPLIRRLLVLVVHLERVVSEEFLRHIQLHRLRGGRRAPFFHQLTGAGRRALDHQEQLQRHGDQQRDERQQRHHVALGHAGHEHARHGAVGLGGGDRRRGVSARRPQAALRLCQHRVHNEQLQRDGNGRRGCGPAGASHGSRSGLALGSKRKRRLLHKRNKIALLLLLRWRGIARSVLALPKEAAFASGGRTQMQLIAGGGVT